MDQSAGSPHQLFTLILFFVCRKNCPAGKECVDLFKCKTVSTAVSEGNLSGDPILQEQLKQIHCGLRDLVAPMVCCETVGLQPKTPENSEPKLEPIRVKDTCGVRKVFSFNIAGGEDTNPGDWPWMAKLIYSQENEPLCGGNRYFYRLASHLDVKLIKKNKKCLPIKDKISPQIP